MGKQDSFYETVNQVIEYGRAQGILQLLSSGDGIRGCQLVIDGREVLNFGSCSYLGLEFHPGLQAGAKAAIENFGTQFSASRAYISAGLYGVLQGLLEKIFAAPCVICPTTSLGHIAALPVLVRDDAAVILDQQVHNSVQTAVQLVRARGVHTALVRHNRMDLLEERVRELRQKYRAIWYMADGIYSMFGDRCPVDTVYHLLEKYPELHFYVDDAHGMSILGNRGRGSVLGDRAIHPRMVLATSLNKAFASGGGLLVFGNPAWARLVGNTGGPLLSSGPMQPGALGAAIAAAKLHLDGTVGKLQEDLRALVQYTNTIIKEEGLPLVSESGSAIFFIGVGQPRAGHHIVRKMLEQGYLVNLGIYPTVPMKQTGIRFTITTLHTHAMIRNMVTALAAAFWSTLAEEGIGTGAIYKAFKMEVPAVPTAGMARERAGMEGGLAIRHCSSIRELERGVWDGLFGGRGCFDWRGLDLLERSFSGNPAATDNWDFDYLLVQDVEGRIVVAGFLTTALWKDDLLAPAAVSAQVEISRRASPGYLTSRVTCCGSLLTEGEHLYINFESGEWKKGVELFVAELYRIQEQRQSVHIVLRDFPSIHPELDQLLADLGFFRSRMPDSYQVNAILWKSPQEYYNRSSKKNRAHFRKKVLPFTKYFRVELIRCSDWEEEVSQWYRLYLNVKERSLELNSFTLPYRLFRNLALSEDWDKLQLTLHEPGDAAQAPCCIVFSYRSQQTYVPLVIGIDYRWNLSHGIYRQALYQLVLRAQKAGMQSIRLGFAAGIEKQKLGAVPAPAYAYIHSADGYNFQALDLYPRSQAQDKGNNHPITQ